MVALRGGRSLFADGVQKEWDGQSDRYKTSLRVAPLSCVQLNDCFLPFCAGML